MMNYKLPALVSMTLLLSACATIKDTFDEGMAFLFDEQPAETVQQPVSKEEHSKFEQPQMRQLAQDRHDRQQEHRVNEFSAKEVDNVSSTHPSKESEITDHSIDSSPERTGVSETSSHQGKASQEIQKPLIANNTANNTPDKKQPSNRQKQQEKAHHLERKNKSEPLRKPEGDVDRHAKNATASEKSSTNTVRPKQTDPESDEAYYAQRGYQDPLRYGFQPRQTHKKVVDYASQLAMELVDRAMGLSTSELVGVTSFVRLNTSLSDTTILGNQLSEYLISELQAYGIGVIDFKVTDGIKVTPRGDIAMDRSGKRLVESVRLDHILTGTMIEDARGVRVNARIVAVKSKRVVASASIHIPAFVVTSLYAGQSSAP
ncbi:FlgO family outer membrane protein [Alteromonas sp. ASW11-130]|uniref:FlgO family outer membrane protein n=1 Tax=Alteromonas sp. ASW11-130 TaxID=3015775 RepID=UPI002241D999|nr:FlgO family outer membrane protein [Alteromonas sp. ASW11-130]MCW8092579.1 FlgO family outer membrane protein [Alteromonas sp. ASW11-130]